MYYKFNSGTNHSELKYIPQIKDLILAHLTCLLRNLYAGQEALELDMVPNWERRTSRLILSPFLFNLYAEYITRNAGLDGEKKNSFFYLFIYF